MITEEGLFPPGEGERGLNAIMLSTPGQSLDEFYVKYMRDAVRLGLIALNQAVTAPGRREIRARLLLTPQQVKYGID